MISQTESLDKIDIQILKALQEDARVTTKELAAKVNLSSTPVFERMKRLEKEGYIKKYVAVLDSEKLNHGFVVFCNVKLNQVNHEIVENLTEKISQIPEVSECYNISGRFDFLLKVYAPDMRHYQEFITNVLGHIASIGSIESSFVVQEAKRDLSIF